MIYNETHKRQFFGETDIESVLRIIRHVQNLFHYTNKRLSDFILANRR